MRYGIFGGTFDPFTYAHYEIVKMVLRDRLVDKVVVIPSIVDYYRKDKEQYFSNAQRLEIIRKWFEADEDVIIDDSEYVLMDTAPALQKDRRYYHTLNDVKHRYGRDNEYMTIVGGDSWNSITSWYRFRELGKMTKFIVVVRSGQPVNYYINHPEFHQQPYKVLELDNRFENISATKIRNVMTNIYDPTLFMDYKGKSTEWYLSEIGEYRRTGKTYEERLCEGTKCIMENMTKDDKTESECVLAKTPIFDLVKCAEVEEGFRPVKVKSKDWVTIIAKIDGKFLMVRQLRHGLGKEFEEFPCGMVEEGENPFTAALRELEEETGLKINTYDMSYLGKFAANPAFMTNYMHYFYIKPKSYDFTDVKFDEHEHIESYMIEKEKAFKNFLCSEGSSIMGCAWMLLMKNGLVV